MTPARTWFWYAMDVLFGMIVPAVCFYFDPIILKVSRPAGFTPMPCPLIGYTAAYFVYPAVGLGILSLSGWLILRHQLPQWEAFFSGIFAVGAVLAGLLSLPMGIAGFPAWATALVYGRNAMEAWNFAKPANSRWVVLLQALGGAVLLLTLAGIAYVLLQALLPPVVIQPCVNFFFSND